MLPGPVFPLVLDDLRPLTFAAPMNAAASTDVFRLALFGLPDDRAVEEVLEKRLGLNRIDARTRLRHLPGVLADPLNRQTAEAALAELQRAGIEAAAVPESEIPDLRHAPTVHHVRCEPAGLVILAMSGEAQEVVPWGELALISIAEVPLPPLSRRTQLPDGVFRHRPGIAQSEPQSSAPDLEMWLVREDPLRAFRIEAELMNYEYLGERRSTSASVNFSELVGDIVKRAPALFLTRTARAYVDQAHIENYRLPSTEAHREFVVLQTLLMRRTRAAEPAAHRPATAGRESAPASNGAASSCGPSGPTSSRRR